MSQSVCVDLQPLVTGEKVPVQPCYEGFFFFFFAVQTLNEVTTITKVMCRKCL